MVPDIASSLSCSNLRTRGRANRKEVKPTGGPTSELRFNDSARDPHRPMVSFMLMRHVRISVGGQISVPAEVRRRWNTHRVSIDDQGDRLVIEPAADDPLSALRGSLEGRVDADSGSLRESARADESAAAERRRIGS